MTLNLTATNRQEEIIKQYLENNVSESLAEKINNGVKTEKDGKSLISKKTRRYVVQPYVSAQAGR